MDQDEVELIYNYLHDHYEYVDGEMVRKKWVSGLSASAIGRIAGHVRPTNGSGRMVTRLSVNFNSKRRCINLDRAIFLYFHKFIPEAITHVDGNCANNKIENLKQTTKSQINQATRPNWKGFIVYHGKRGTRYYAKLQVDSKEISLGGFNTPEEAHEAYLKAKANYENP
tara:strand:- start:16321 stop:16827 length:507 start_codon:yes stop_codon:yes gene_type:complete